jgi:shikimate kinase
MGAGKSTVGRIVAERLCAPFVDLDARIGDIPAIWEAEGEAGFRRRETEALRVVAAGDGVLALGGGALLADENRALLANWRVVILLAPFEVLAARIGADPGRPLAGRLQETLRQREALWPRCGPIVDSSAAAADRVADAVISICCSID